MGFLESHTPSVAAMTQGSLAAGHFDENSPHRFGGSSEEVTSPVELQVPDQPKVCLVHKTGGIEGVARGFRSHSRGGELPQLIMDEREQLRGGLAVSTLNGF